MIKDNVLKQCPFCGNEATITVENDHTTNYNTKLTIGCSKSNCFCKYIKWFYADITNKRLEWAKKDGIKICY